ncbi:hypothetical protein LUZ60_003417 [Juncus effusus]|nr:hypothetical protein LUZ60_003417 [Juncus effusus]
MSDGSGKRARTACEKLRKKAPSSIHVEFEEDGTPTGPLAANFTTYLAVLARDHIPCTIEDWRRVDVQLKEDLWTEVKDYWNIVDDTHKKKIIRRMGEDWKSWKGRLVRDFIRRPNPKNPCDVFNISEEAWAEFRRQKESDDFKRKSEKGKEAQKHNIHPHRLGSAGYKGLKSDSNEVILSSSSSSGVSSVVDSRSWRWLRARAKPTAEGFLTVPNPATNEVLQRVETKVQEASQGLFQSDRYNDILSSSIGTPEHPGRIRGHSTFATLSTVYGKVPRKKTSHAGCITQAELDAKINSALAKQAEEFNEQIRMLASKLNDAPHLQTSPQDFRPPTQMSSNPVSAQQHIQENQGPTPCKLWVLHDEGRIFVAHGKLYPSGPGVSIHNIPIPPDHVRVCIDNVIEGLAYVRVPCPVDDTEHVGQLIGTYVAWPAHLVELPDKAVTAKKSAPVKKKKPDMALIATPAVERDSIVDEATLLTMNKKSKWLYTVLMSQPPDIWDFDIPFGEEAFGIDGSICLSISDIVDLFKNDWLNVSILQIFCMVCARQCAEFGLDNFLFVDPYRCSESMVASDLSAAASYLADVMKAAQNPDSYILLPYISREHWILLAIQMSKFNVYIVNPTNQNVPGLLIYNALNIATRIFCSDKDMKSHKKLTYSRIKGPLQPGGSECGYYVMRTMWDIITIHGQSGPTLPNSIGPETYPEQDIEEMKDRVVEFICENI